MASAESASVIEDWMVVIATCCREWPVLIGTSPGYCGYCNGVPVIRR